MKWRIPTSSAEPVKGIHRTWTLLMKTSIAVVRFTKNPCHRHIGPRPLEDFVNNKENSLIQALLIRVDIVHHTLLMVSPTR
jgi:hypothetical protein